MQKPLLSKIRGDVEALLSFDPALLPQDIQTIHDFFQHLVEDADHPIEEFIGTFSQTFNFYIGNRLFGILNETYHLVTQWEYEQVSSAYQHLSKIEHNRQSLDVMIQEYTSLVENALHNDDEELHIIYNICLGFLREFQKNPDNALAYMVYQFKAIELFKQEPSIESFLRKLKNNKTSAYMSVMVRYEDRLRTLYQLFEGYAISKEKILKSAGLKIFNLFELKNSMKKNILAQRIEYLFASLGENIRIDPKKATMVKLYRHYKNIPILDYARNKKGSLLSQKLAMMYDGIIESMIIKLKDQGMDDFAERIRDKADILHMVAFLKTL